MYIRQKREHKIDPCGKAKKTKQNKIKRCDSYTHIVTTCFFSSKRILFHCSFYINTLIMKINQKTIMQTIKCNYVSVRIS